MAKQQQKQQYTCGSIADIINSDIKTKKVKKEKKEVKLETKEMKKISKSSKLLSKKTSKKNKMKNLFDEIVEENRGKVVDLPRLDVIGMKMVDKIKNEKEILMMGEGSGDDDEDDDERLTRKRPKKTDSPEKKERTIFVGNLPVDIDVKKLKKLFQTFGDIQSVRLRGAAPAKPNLPKKVAIITKQLHPGKDCIHGYIVFKSRSDVDKALSMNGHDLEGHHLRVDTLKQSHDQSSSIFIGNLPFSVKEEEVRTFFSDCGQIESVRIVRDNYSGMGKGFGFIAFHSLDSVILALEKNELEFGGRNIRVKQATSENATKDKSNKTRHKKDSSEMKREVKDDDSSVVKREVKVKKDKQDFKGVSASKTHSLKVKKNKKKSVKQNQMIKKQKKIAEILSR